MKKVQKQWFLIAMLAALVLPAKAQWKQENNRSIGAEAPTVTFHSTSVYSSQWQADNATPLLDSDGSLNSDAYMSSSGTTGRIIRKGPGTPGIPGDNKQPLGDAAWPLAICAIAYIMLRTMRAHRRVRDELPGC